MELKQSALEAAETSAVTTSLAQRQASVAGHNHPAR